MIYKNILTILLITYSFSLFADKPVKISKKSVAVKVFTTDKGKLAILHSPKKNLAMFSTLFPSSKTSVILPVTSYNEIQKVILSYLNSPFKKGNTLLYRGSVKATLVPNNGKQQIFNNLILVVKTYNNIIDEADFNLHFKQRNINFFFYDISSGKNKAKGIKELTFFLEARSLNGADLSPPIKEAFQKIQ